MALTLRSLVVALLMLAVYELSFRGIAPRYAPRAENVPVANQMSAQQFLYGQAPSAVILGSSLSGRIRSDLLPDGSYNLALGGLSVWDGLAVVEATGRFPDLLMVEANVLDRPASPDFARGVIAQPLRSLRAHIKSLRAAARPLTVGLSYAQAVWRRLLPVTTTAAPAQPGSAAPFETALDRRFAQLLEVQMQRYGKAMSDEELTALAQSADRLVALADRGVRIEFFELPVHPGLCEQARPRQLRAWVQARYPDLHYRRVGRCSDVRTTDGVHLDAMEAEDLTREMAVFLENNS